MKRIFYDKSYLILGIVTVAVVTLYGGFGGYVFLYYPVKGNRIFGFAFWSVINVVLDVALIHAIRTKFMNYTGFDKSDVVIRSGGKKERISYSSFREVYRGCYTHMTYLGIGKPVYFIVISPRRMTLSSLASINRLKLNDTIMVRATKKNVRMVYQMLPPHLQSKMKTAFAQDLSETA